MTVASGAFVKVDAGVTLTITGTATVNGTLVTAGTFTNNGSTVINGTFQINQGGFGGGTNDFSYGASSTLIYNFTQNTTYGPVDAGHRYFPTTNSPTNVILQQTGTGAVQMGKTVSIAGALSSAGANTKNFDLQGFGFTAASLAVGANLTMAGSSALTITGNAALNAGTFTLSGSVGGDLKVGGDFTRAAAATFTPNSRAVFFNGSGTQNVTVTGGGTQTFNFVQIQNTSVVKLASATDVTINSASGLTLSSTAANCIDLNGRTMTLTGGGNLSLSSGARGIMSSVAGGSFAVSGATLTVSNGGTLTFGSNVIVKLSNGLNPGASLTTINGTLQINSGGFVSTNAPTYGTGSLLQYNSGTNPYSRGIEWTTATSGPGFPYHVQVSNTTTLDYPNGDFSARAMGGNLTVDGGSAFYMDYGAGSTNNPLTVAGNVLFTGNISLGDGVGGDMIVGGNWTQVAPGVIFVLGREVSFNGTGTQTLTTINSFDNVRIAKTAGSVVLNSNVQLNSILTFDAVNVAHINTGSNVLIVFGSAGSEIVRTGSGHVIGFLRRGIGFNSNPYFYPVGTATGYTPVNLTFNNVMNTGKITVKSNDGNPYTALYGLSASKYLNRYWSVTNDVTTFTSVSASFDYLVGDLSGGAIASMLRVAKFDAPSTWSYPATVATMYNLVASGLTSFSDFTAAECNEPSIQIDVTPTVCQGTTTANLVYTNPVGSPDQYSLDYDAAANMAGFVDIVNAPLPASPIVLVIPGMLAPGSYNATITVRNSATNCEGIPMPFAAVMVNLAATADAGGPYTACGTSPVSITAMANGLGTWSTTGIGVFGDATSLSTTYTPDFSEIGTTFDLTWTTDDPDDLDPCPSASSNAALTVNTPATADAGGPYTSNCGTAPVNITAMASGTGSWSGGAGTFGSATSLSTTYTPTMGEIGTTVTLTWTTDDPDAAGPCAEVFSNASLTISSSEIDITGLGMSITDGDNTPDVADDTEFGNADVTLDMPIHTFTVSNTGSTDLIVSSVVSTDPAQFAVGALTPASPVPAGMSATFTVTFDPSSAGLKMATITVNNNDCDEGVYDFAVQGTGTGSCPTITFTATGSPFCTGGMAGSIAITGVSGGLAPYQYSIDNGMTYSGMSTFTGLAAGSYNVKVKDANNCESAVTVVTINTVTQKTANAGADWTTCINGVVQLNGQIGGGAVSSTWSDGGIGGVFQNANMLFTRYTPPSGYNTPITITLTTNGPCAGTDNLTINFATPPTIEMTASAVASATCGDIITVTIDATSNFIDMSSLQYSVGWDPAQLMYQSSVATPIGGATPAILSGLPDLLPGQLTYVWYDPAGYEGEDVTNGSALLTITFKVISSSGFAAVNILGTPTPIEGTNSQFCVLPYLLHNNVNIALQSKTATISGTSTICNGQSTTLTASVGASYLWSTGATTQAITVTPGMNTTYTVQVTTADGCTAVASQLVTVNPVPVAVINGITTICEGTSTTLTASGGTTYLWSTGATTAAITVSPTTTTTYTVTATSLGCSADEEAIVTVNPLETANAGPDQSTCEEGIIHLVGVVGGGASGGTWTANIGGGIFYPDANQLDVYYIPPPSYTGAIVLTLTTNGPCPVSDNVTINYGTLPPLELTASGPANAICGDMITFTIVATTGFNRISSLDYSLNWNPSKLGFVSHTETVIENAPDFNANNTNIGQLTYSWADQLGYNGETRADGFVLQTVTMKVLVSSGDYGVSITSMPTLLEATNPELCILPVTLTNLTTHLDPIVVTCPGNMAVCLYDPLVTLTGGMPSGGTYTGTGVSSNMFNPATAGIGTHTITYSYTAPSGCSNFCTYEITVNPTPDVDQPSNQVLCNGEMTAAVAFSGTVLNTVFNWTNNTASIGLVASGTGDIAAFTAVNTTNAPVVATIEVTPEYTFGGTTCYGAAKTFTITVNPTPTVNDPADQMVCNNDMTSVVFTGFVPGTVYDWTNDNTSIGIGAMGTGDIASFTAINTGSTTQIANLTVTPSFTNDGVTCLGTPQSFTITVYPTPDAVATPSAQTICSGDAIATIALTGNVSGTVFNWTRDNMGVTGIAGSGSGDISGNLTNTTNAPVTVTFTIIPTANGCDGTAITASVVVNPTPTVNDPLDQAICNGVMTTAVVFSGFVPGTVYDWTNDNPSIGLVASGTGDIASFTATNAGFTTQVANLTVTPSFTNAGGTCLGTPQDFTITVYPTPDATATPSAQTICSGDAIAAIVLTGNVSGTVFNWTRDNMGVTGIAGSGSGDISGNLNNTTNAPITVTFTIIPTANGCDGTAITASVVVNPTPTVNDPLDQAICNGVMTTAVVFSGNVPGTVYDWTNDNPSIGLVASGTGDIASFTATNAGFTTQVANLTVTPSFTNAGGTCLGTPQDFTITVYPTPNAVATPSAQPICSGSAITTIVLSGGVSGTVFNWTRDNLGVTGIAASGSGDISGSLSNTTNAPITVTFTIIPTANSCDGTPITATVVVNPIPDAVATPAAQSLCSGTAMTPILFSSMVSGTAFNWTRDMTSEVTGVGASGMGDINGTLVNTTNAPVTVTFTITPVADNCSGMPIMATVTVYPIPSGANDNAAICSGTMVNYDLQNNINTLGNGVVSNFNWLALTNNPNITGESLVSTSGDFITDNLINTSNLPQTVLYRVTPQSDPGACPGAFFDVFVMVDPLPNVLTTDAADPICSGSQTNITVSNPNNVAGTTYNWSAPATAGILELGSPITVTGVLLVTPIQQTLTNTTNAPVLVTFTVTPVGPAPSNCPGIAVTETVLVNPTPAGTISASSNVICNGTSTMLTFTATAGTGNFDIVVNGTTYPNVVSGSVFATVSPSMTTVYNLTNITDIGVTPNCTNSSPGSSVMVTVTPSPTAVLSGSTTICNGGSATLSLAVTGTGTISGTLSDGTVFSGTAPTIMVSVSPVATTVYTIATLLDDACTGLPADLTGSATVTVNDRPTGVISGGATLCDGASTTLTLTVTGSGTISGLLSDGTPFSGTAPTIMVMVSPSMTTNYMIGSLMDANCAALPIDLSGSALVTVNARPTAVISGTTAICEGMSATLILTVTGSGTISGTLSDGTVFSGTAPTISVMVSPITTTIYTVSTLIDDNCTATGIDLTGSATVTVNARPTGVLSGTTTICEGLDAMLTITVTGTGTISGTLSDGTVFSGTAPSITVTVSPAMTTVYTIATLMDNNCVAIMADLSGTATVTVNNCSDITGKLIWEGDRLTMMTGVNLATVTLSGSDSDSDVTGLPGTYTLTATMGNNFIVTPVKNRPMPHAINGLTAADASRIQQHVIGAFPFTDPYKMIAADANKSNSISVADASLIQQAVLGNPSVQAYFAANTWRFVPKAYVFPDPLDPWSLGMAPYFPESITLTNGASGQDFIGMKLGDVNSTANPVNFSGQTPDLKWVLNDQFTEEDATFEVEFKAENFNDLLALQFGLQFNPAALQFIEIQNIPGSPMQAGNFGLYNLAAGEIKAFLAMATAKDLPNGTPVFRVKFKALQSGRKLSDLLQLSQAVLLGEAYSSQYIAGPVSLVYTTLSTGTSGLADAGVLQLLQNRPNPFAEQTAIGFVLPEACTAQIRVLDVSGRLIEEQEAWFSQGYHEMLFKFDGYGGQGVLYYELTTPMGTLSKKMILVRN